MVSRLIINTNIINMGINPRPRSIKRTQSHFGESSVWKGVQRERSVLSLTQGPQKKGRQSYEDESQTRERPLALVVEKTIKTGSDGDNDDDGGRTSVGRNRKNPT